MRVTFPGTSVICENVFKLRHPAKTGFQTRDKINSLHRLNWNVCNELYAQAALISVVNAKQP